MIGCPSTIVDIGPGLVAILGQALLTFGAVMAAQRVQSAIVAGSNGKSKLAPNGNGVPNAVP